MGKDFKMKIILASSSPYRKNLLSRLDYPFDVFSPQVDETQIPKNLMPKEISSYLAEKKAQEVFKQYPQDLIIGCDQVVECEGLVLGKPLTTDNHVKQLHFLNNKSHFLHSAVCLLSSKTKDTWVHTTEIIFRHLTDSEIQNYVGKHEALDCAGGYKIESFGIGLIKKMITDDPTGIEGLPLISLHEKLINIHSL